MVVDQLQLCDSSCLHRHASYCQWLLRHIQKYPCLGPSGISNTSGLMYKAKFGATICIQSALRIISYCVHCNHQCPQRAFYKMSICHVNFLSLLGNNEDLVERYIAFWSLAGWYEIVVTLWYVTAMHVFCLHWGSMTLFISYILKWWVAAFVVMINSTISQHLSLEQLKELSWLLPNHLTEVDSLFPASTGWTKWTHIDVA